MQLMTNHDIAFPDAVTGQVQTGTELDREMMRKADRMMDAPLWENSSGAEVDDKRQQ
jgi:hypothetical protein